MMSPFFNPVEFEIEWICNQKHAVCSFLACIIKSTCKNKFDVFHASVEMTDLPMTNSTLYSLKVYQINLVCPVSSGKLPTSFAYF